MQVPRDQVLAFAVYAQDRGTLKLTGQLYPLMPDESREVRLELKPEGEDQWRQVATEAVQYPGWSVHFRLDDWDNTQNVHYRLRHGDQATFEGLIRKDPIDKDVIVVAAHSPATAAAHPVHARE